MAAVVARNAANSGDVTAVQVNASYVTQLGGAAGVSINGGAALTGQTGSGASIVTNTGPTISDPTITGNTNVKRLKANQGSSIVTGDVGSLGSGWENTASVSAVSGNDVIGSISILSNGTGQGPNAAFVLTFHDGTWTTAPLCLAPKNGVKSNR